MTTTIASLKSGEKVGKIEDVIKMEICHVSEPITYLQNGVQKKLVKLATADLTGDIIVLVFDENIMKILPGADGLRKVLKCGGIGGAYT